MSALSEKAQRLHAAVREASQDQPSFRKINKFTVTSHSIMQCCGVGLNFRIIFCMNRNFKNTGYCKLQSHDVF